MKLEEKIESNISSNSILFSQIVEVAAQNNSSVSLICFVLSGFSEKNGGEIQRCVCESFHSFRKQRYTTTPKVYIYIYIVILFQQ